MTLQHCIRMLPSWESKLCQQGIKAVAFQYAQRLQAAP